MLPLSTIDGEQKSLLCARFCECHSIFPISSFNPESPTQIFVSFPHWIDSVSIMQETVRNNSHSRNLKWPMMFCVFGFNISFCCFFFFYFFSNSIYLFYFLFKFSCFLFFLFFFFFAMMFSLKTLVLIKQSPRPSNSAILENFKSEINNQNGFSRIYKW